MRTPVNVSVAVETGRSGTAFERRFVVPGVVVALLRALLTTLFAALLVAGAAAVAPPLVVAAAAFAGLLALPVVLPLLVVRAVSGSL